jgi:hypothetical protein
MATTRKYGIIPSQSNARDLAANDEETAKKSFRKEPEAPPDPYAYVTAPKRPRPSGRSAAAVAEMPEE